MTDTIPIVLNDVCQLIVDCEHKTAPTQEFGYPSIRTPNIGRGRLLLDGVNRVSDETYAAWTQRAVPQAGDIILAREAPIGNAAIIPPGLNVCLGQRTVLIRADRTKILPDYLVYLLISDEIQNRIKSLSNGATVHHLNMKDIRGLNLPRLPALDQQRRIASLLSAYDDLIENNVRIKSILEEMASRVYEEWFVQYRFPSHESVKLISSEKGLIPEGWGVNKFSDVLISSRGGDWGSDKPDQKHTELVSVVRGTDFDDITGGKPLRNPKRFIEKSSFEKRMLKFGDLIVENSINAKSRSAGKTLFVTKDILDRLGGDAIAASFCRVFRFKDLGIATLAHMKMQAIFNSGDMVFYQNVATNGIANFQATRFVATEWLTFPSDKSAFESMLALLNDLNSCNYSTKIANLFATRDHLLPKLISGEIDVSEIFADFELLAA